ncbi:iron chaperone [Kitasatospora sp. NPDC004240]
MSAATAKNAKSAETAGAKYDGFSEDEKSAMKEHAKEMKAAARRGAKADTEGEVLAKIAEMAEADRVLAERVHAIVKAAAPELTAKTWYGMPAYARAGKVVCFFQSAEKFKSRYATLGFSDQAFLDEGAMWATSYALVELTAEVEARITELVKKAAG